MHLYFSVWFCLCISLMCSIVSTAGSTHTGNSDHTLSLRQLVRKCSIKARLEEAISSSKIIKFLTLPSNGVQFIVSVIEKTSRAVHTVTTTTDDNVSPVTDKTANSGSATVPHLDPFSPEAIAANPLLYVTKVGPAHHLLLNKFNTFADHTVLVTDKFQYQSDPLTSADFTAWHSAMVGMSAVGLFNSHPLAGASQRHRHMQMVPLDVIWEARMKSGQTDAEFQLPIDYYIMPHIERGQWRRLSPDHHHASSARYRSRGSGSGDGQANAVYTLPQFDFLHGIVPLLNPAQWAYAVAKGGDTASSSSGSWFATQKKQQLTYGDYLQEAYVSLLEHTNSLLSDSHSHSQSLTQSPPNDDAYAKYLRLLPSATSGSSEAAAAAATVASASSKVPGTDMKICRAYNLLLTENWMMLVSRSEGAYINPRTGVTVRINAFGFLGLLLARDGIGEGDDDSTTTGAGLELQAIEQASTSSSSSSSISSIESTDRSDHTHSSSVSAGSAGAADTDNGATGPMAVLTSVTFPAE